MAFKVLRDIFGAESTTPVSPDPLERVEPFNYDAIPETGFVRLVQLEVGDKNSPIRCKLITKPLSKEAKYRALSYVWGDPTDKKNIICNHFRLEVTNNLHAALLQLRASSDQGDASLLWIDAICIDQNNIIEKTAQIKMMKDIYSKASFTIIWLGERFESGGGNPQAIDSYEGIRLLKAIHAATAGLSSPEKRINAALQLINPPNSGK